MKERVKYIDVAKGLCMLSVIWFHVSSEFLSNEFLIFLNEIINAFIMPLFFLTSGFFVKEEAWSDFIKKKVRVLLVPFTIFYLLGFSLAYIASTYLGIRLHNDFSVYNIFAVFFSRTFSNGALWFLIALFFSSIFMQLSLRIKNKIFRHLFILVISIIGFFWNDVLNFRLPLYIDTAFTALLFLYLGYLSKSWIYKLKRNWFVIVIMVVLVPIIFSLRNSGGGMMSNIYSNNLFSFYFLSVASSLFIFLLSVIIGSSIYLELIGKNSIIPLCTHFFFIKPIYMLINQIYVGDWSVVLCYSIICVLMIPVIHIVNLHFPFLIGKSFRLKQNFAS